MGNDLAQEERKRRSSRRRIFWAPGRNQGAGGMTGRHDVLLVAENIQNTPFEEKRTLRGMLLLRQGFSSFPSSVSILFRPFPG